MKRTLTLIFAVILTLCAWAQKPSLNKAYNLYYDKDFVKAKEAIDLCTTDEKLSKKAQTWLYKGNICYFLANNEYGAKQKDSQYLIRYPDAPAEAYDAFCKALELNPNVEAMDMFAPREAMAQLYPLLLVRGVDQLIAKDYNGAKSTLAKGIASYEAGIPQYPMKGDLYYYYAYTLEMLNEQDSVRSYYEKAIQDGSANPYVFVRLAESHKNENNKAKARETLDKAKAALPADMSVTLAEIDYLYWTGDSAAAATLLHQIPVGQVKNADELVNLANFYIKEKDYEKAVTLLEKANALSSGNFVILYNLGVCEYNLSEQYFNQYNKIAVSDPGNTQAVQYKEQSSQYLTQAAEHFEQARLHDPKDLNLLNTLRAIYARQQSPKYDEIDRIIKELE